MWTSLGDHYSANHVICSTSDAVWTNPSNWCSMLAWPKTEHVTQGMLIRHWNLNLGLSDPMVENG